MWSNLLSEYTKSEFLKARLKLEKYTNNQKIRDFYKKLFETKVKSLTNPIRDQPQVFYLMKNEKIKV